jgi:hypothetical protein
LDEVRAPSDRISINAASWPCHTLPNGNSAPRFLSPLLNIFLLTFAFFEHPFAIIAQSEPCPPINPSMINHIGPVILDRCFFTAPEIIQHEESVTRYNSLDESSVLAHWLARKNFQAVLN